MSFALATPVTDFQRQHRRNVETGCRGGTEGGEVTVEECCIAPRCRVEPFLDQGGASRAPAGTSAGLRPWGGPGGAHRPSRGWPPLIRSADSAHKPVLPLPSSLAHPVSSSWPPRRGRSLPLRPPYRVRRTSTRRPLARIGAIEADGSGEPSGHGRAWATVLTCRVGPKMRGNESQHFSRPGRRPGRDG